MMVKVRNGFVSNSSSSSFVIAILNPSPKLCPTCGRKDPAFIEAIRERNESGYCDDTEIEWEGIEEGIKEIQAEIDECQSYVDKYKQMDPESQVQPDGSFDWTHGEAVTSYGDDIKQCLERIEEYKKWGEAYKRIIGLSVSYHDSAVNDMLSSNNIKILSGD